MCIVCRSVCLSVCLRICLSVGLCIPYILLASLRGVCGVVCGVWGKACRPSAASIADTHRDKAKHPHMPAKQSTTRACLSVSLSVGRQRASFSPAVCLSVCIVHPLSLGCSVGHLDPCVVCVYVYVYVSACLCVCVWMDVCVRRLAAHC